MKMSEIEKEKIEEEMSALAKKVEPNLTIVSEEKFIEGLDEISNKMKQTSSIIRNKIAEMKNFKTTEDLSKGLKC